MLTGAKPIPPSPESPWGMVGGVKEEDLLLAAVRHGDAENRSAVGPADVNAAWREYKDRYFIKAAP